MDLGWLLGHDNPEDNVQQYYMRRNRDEDGEDKQDAHQDDVYPEVIGQSGGYAADDPLVHVTK